MNLKEYVEELQEFLEEHPELAEADVAYATDDEGNSYCSGVYSPSVRYRPTSESEYHFETALDEDDLEDYDGPTVPIVLIN